MSTAKIFKSNKNFKLQQYLPWVNELIHCGLVMPYDDKIWVNIGSGNGL